MASGSVRSFGDLTTFYPFRAHRARQPNPACAAGAARFRSAMLSGPIYKTGSIGWAKGGHGLAHTGLIFNRHLESVLVAEHGAGWNHALIAISPQSYQ